MNVLLVNPNTYKAPPVPPIGLEYISCSLEQQGHRVEILDLCFSKNPIGDIDSSCMSFRPDVVGMTVRNVDTVLYHTNEFFLDEIKTFIEHIQSKLGLQVIVGGTGILTNPSGVLEYLNADFAVIGPGENALHELMHAIQTQSVKGKLLHGSFSSEISCLRSPGNIDYKKYCDQGGIAGFRTHNGCSSSCAYCIEANAKISFKKIESVIAEIKSFVDRGYNHFHLCDSEFNESLDYSVEFCRALKNSGLQMQWAVYMKPSDFSRNLLKLMKDTGVYIITLTVDTWKKCAAYWTDIEKFVFTAKPMGIKIAIDFLTGFPHEKEEEMIEALNTLRRIQPNSISVNTYIRLYKTLPITKIIENDPSLQKFLLGNTEDNTYIKPVFYNQVTTERLKEIIGDDPLFRIEGLEKGVNYLRV